MQPSGLVMRPCSLTEEENEERMRNNIYWTESDFYQKYCSHIAAQQLISEAAKIYILANWSKILDWSDLDIHIKDNTGKETHYYKFNGNDGWNMQISFVKKMLARKEKEQLPVKTITDVVLDPTDGDFSLTINGHDHLWIHDDSVIELADFIEKKLMPNEQGI